MRKEQSQVNLIIIKNNLLNVHVAQLPETLDSSWLLKYFKAKNNTGNIKTTKDKETMMAEGNRKKGTSVIISKDWIKSQAFKALQGLSRGECFNK